MIGCASGGDSTGAPPTVVCGTVLSKSAAGQPVIDATHGNVRLKDLMMGEPVYLRVTRDCAHGATITLIPGDDATVVAKALAKDGLPAGVVLQPRIHRPWTMTVGRDGRDVRTVAHVKVGHGSYDAAACCPARRLTRPADVDAPPPAGATLLRCGPRHQREPADQENYHHCLDRPEVSQTVMALSLPGH
jgi:hypothetical protein